MQKTNSTYLLRNSSQTVSVAVDNSDNQCAVVGVDTDLRQFLNLIVNGI